MMTRKQAMEIEKIIKVERMKIIMKKSNEEEISINDLIEILSNTFNSLDKELKRYLFNNYYIAYEDYNDDFIFYPLKEIVFVKNKQFLDELEEFLSVASLDNNMDSELYIDYNTIWINSIS